MQSFFHDATLKQATADSKELCIQPRLKRPQIPSTCVKSHARCIDF